MDVKGSNLNLASAMTLPSYKPAWMRAKPARSREKLALVVPALHEAANLGPLLSRVLQALECCPIAWEVIVVDDDSRDGTEEIVAAIARQNARVRLLVRRGQRGLAGAILHGWRHTDATILGAMDADGQHPPEVLPELLAAIGRGRDAAIASRYAKGARRANNPVRRLMSLAAILAALPLQPMSPRVLDPLSGFFLVRRPSVENILFQTTGFKLLLEILVCGRIVAVEEIPLRFGRRQSGQSKLNLAVARDYLAMLARMYRARALRRRAEPSAAVADPLPPRIH